MKSVLGIKIHAMFDDRLERVYVFPTGDNGLGRAGIALSEYSDEFQKTNDPDSGDLVYWIYNRYQIALNPVHKYTPIVRNIKLV